MKTEQAPSDCPECGAPAYIGFSSVYCTNKGCMHYDAGTAEAHAEEVQAATVIPKDTPPQLIEEPPAWRKNDVWDEDTAPGGIVGPRHLAGKWGI